MEALIGRLKRNITLASKSVLLRFRQYVCFYIAFFIIQLLFGLVTMSAASADSVRIQQVSDSYDYHVCLVGVNEAQYKALVKDASVIRTDVRAVDGEIKVYDIYCRFDGDGREGFEEFNSQRLELVQGEKYGNIKVNVSYSPLYKLKDEMRRNTFIRVALLSAVFIIGTVVTLLLYRVRVDHFKFTYGIYMSFGADFRKLFETSFWEMLMISLFTVIPAAVSATLADLCFFSMNGLKYIPAPQYMLLAIPFSAVIAYVSVRASMKRVSRTPPLRLLLAEDNSGLVVSPRLSFNMVSRTFTRSYSFFSAVRFRRYNLRLILSSVTFSLLFVLSAFLGDVYGYALSVEKPEYTVQFDTESYGGDALTPELSEELRGISGVTGIYKSCSARAYQIASYMKVSPSKVKASAGMLRLDDMCYTNRVCYYATDGDIVDFLTSGFDYRGDPSLLLTNTDVDKHYVIVTNTKDNAVSMKLDVGDHITLAKFVEITDTTDEPLSGNRQLQYLVENGVFDNERFEVCAVIDGMSSGSNYPLFISEADYRMMTGKYPRYNEVDVYVDRSLSGQRLSSLTDKLQSWADKYPGASVTLNGSLENRDAELAQCRTPLIIASAFAMLAVMPLIYCFSQIMFYGKRKREFELLRGMGAINSEIRSVFLRDGAFYAISGGAITALLGGGLLYVVSKVTAVMTSGGIFVPRYVTSGTWQFWLIGVLVTAVCGAVSSIIPYIAFFIERRNGSPVGTECINDDIDI